MDVKDNAPLVSIITPVFNGLSKLPSTFESVLAQPISLYEYLIIDGASADGTADWLHGNEQPNMRWISEQDTGVYDAMNKGINLAKGNFLLFLGAGDRLIPGALEHLANFVGQNPSRKPRFIYGDVRNMQTRLPLTEGRFTKVRICRENICHQGIFYERSIFDLFGGYELTYRIMADWVFNLRCFGESRIAKLHLPEMIADFEGGGLCLHTPDVPFARNRQRLITERFGIAYGFLFRIATGLERRFRHFSKF